MQIILQGGKSMLKLDGGEGMGINMWMGGPGGWLLLLEELDGSRVRQGGPGSGRGAYPVVYAVVAYLGGVLQTPDLSSGETAWGEVWCGGKEMQLSMDEPHWTMGNILGQIDGSYLHSTSLVGYLSHDSWNGQQDFGSFQASAIQVLIGYKAQQDWWGKQHRDDSLQLFYMSGSHDFALYYW
ncbi:hypothetical protein BKA83DRAFT_4123868 [Pisolithus microcarpus]|nr:hypothetical protein BKA83DRAFT_4123868 [Pisolithus microcarpus]